MLDQRKLNSLEKALENLQKDEKLLEQLMELSTNISHPHQVCVCVCVQLLFHDTVFQCFVPCHCSSYGVRTSHAWLLARQSHARLLARQLLNHMQIVVTILDILFLAVVLLTTNIRIHHLHTISMRLANHMT